MFRYIVPHRTSAHRVAVIALYRALLSQTSALPTLSPTQRTQLQTLIRTRFRQSRHFQRPAKLRLRFEAGYEAIDLLDAAVASPHDAAPTARILSLLSRAPLSARSPQPLSPATSSHPRSPGSSAPPIDAMIRDTVPPRPRLSLSDRPLPLHRLSGPRRHVPVLFNASQIPVLRFTKPQPRALSAFIVSRLRQRQARHDRRARLEDARMLARWEDAWDGILERNAGVSGAEGHASATSSSSSSSSSWVREVEVAIAEVGQALAREKAKNRVMAERMQALVDREQALFEQERG